MLGFHAPKTGGAVLLGKTFKTELGPTRRRFSNCITLVACNTKRARWVTSEYKPPTTFRPFPTVIVRRRYSLPGRFSTGGHGLLWSSSCQPSHPAADKVGAAHSFRRANVKMQWEPPTLSFFFSVGAIHSFMCGRGQGQLRMGATSTSRYGYFSPSI